VFDDGRQFPYPSG